MKYLARNTHRFAVIGYIKNIEVSLKNPNVFSATVVTKNNDTSESIDVKGDIPTLLKVKKLGEKQLVVFSLKKRLFLEPWIVEIIS
jgi:hypothetical protein